MPSNEVISAALSADPVPPDRECIRSLTDVLQGSVDFLKIVGVANASQGGAFPTNNNVAQQALNTANSALSLAQSLQSDFGQRRTGGPIVLPSGNPVSVLTFNPPMSNTNYIINVMPVGPDTADDQFTWRLIEGTNTVNSAQIKWSGVPANFSFYWEAQSL